MDRDEFRAILSRSRVGIWALIDTAIRVAASDDGEEFRRRRDEIVEALYAPAAAPQQLCRNCSGGNDVVQDEPYYPQCITDDAIENIDNNNNVEVVVGDKKNTHSDDDKNSDRTFSGGEEGEDLDPYGGLFNDDDDEQTKIAGIKEQLDDPNQSEEAVVDLLQSLADMDVTFQALKETDIGRHVNRLRKHTSNEVRGLVKQLVRKWKDIVDEWVRVNQPQQANSNLDGKIDSAFQNDEPDGDSPQQKIPKNQQNGHHQVPDFGYSPNPRNGRSSSVERHYVGHETKPKPPQSASRREPPSKPPQSVPKPTFAPPNRAQGKPAADDERLNSARKRLQENYQEANNAKKQRTIQVMDIHEIPKPKNGFFSKNKGGFHGRNHR